MRQLLILLGLFAALYILPLGARPLVVPDEARYAEIPREMLDSGDWIVPHLNGLRYFEKPPLGYWLNAAAIKLFGENRFAVRLPSALSVGLTALLLFLWARRYSDDKTVPLFATTIFLLSFEVLTIGTFCILDAVLTLWVTGAVVAFFFAFREQRARVRTTLLVLAGVACGLAFLTKGFLALVVPAIVLVPFALWERRFRDLVAMSWIPLTTAVLVALPWSILIYRREPDFWHYFFWVEHVGRFLSPDGDQHAEPFWYYIPVLLGGALPWTPLLGPIVQGMRWTNWKDSTLRLAVCWVVLPFLFFSLCSGKLGTYLLPCFPPLALLIAVSVLKCLSEGDVKGFITGAWVIVGAAVVMFVALVVGLILVPKMSTAVSLWKWGVVAAGLLLWMGLSRTAMAPANVHRRLALYCAGPVLFMFSWSLVSPAALNTRKAPVAFLASHAGEIPADSILITDNALTASICWCYKRADACIVGNTGEYAYGLAYEDGQHKLIEMDQIGQFVAENTPTRHVVIITREDLYREDYELLLPRPADITIHERLVFAKFDRSTRHPNVEPLREPDTDELVSTMDSDIARP